MAKARPVKQASTLAKTKTMKVTPFQASVYALTSQIPRGNVTTYGRIAKALNSSPRAGTLSDAYYPSCFFYRLWADPVVGNALRRNPYAPRVPCHRVIANTLFVGGFQGVWDLNGCTAPKKLDLLKGEGVLFDSRGYLKDSRLVFDEFKSETTVRAM
jgi:methylated-DNA-[protein]-cysteine S-methyltransferase